MTITRNQAAEALFALLQSAWSFAYSSMRLKSYADIVSGVSMPALFLEESLESHRKDKEYFPMINDFEMRRFNKDPTPARRTLEYNAYVFINDGLDPDTTPIETMNNILDAIDPVSGGVLAPNDKLQNLQNLGGYAYNCYICGHVLKIPGDIDGIGVMRVPIKVIFN